CLFTVPAPTSFYTLSLHDALPILLPIKADCDAYAALQEVIICKVRYGLVVVNLISNPFCPIPIVLIDGVYIRCIGDVIALNHFRSEEHTSELQSRENLVCRLLLEK